MLLADWASNEFKSEMTEIMKKMMENSGIQVRSTFLQSRNRNSIIGDLLSSNNECLQSFGRGYFEEIEKMRHEVLENLYLDLVHSYLASRALGRDECAFLKSLLDHMASSNQLSIDSALKVYTILQGVDDAEDVVLMTLLKRLQRLTVLNEKSSSNLRKILRSVIQSKSCKALPHLGLCLAYEAYRLKIFTQKSIKSVAALHKRTIEAVDIDPSYNSEKFDVLSDFMLYYSLKSAPGLKTSIMRRINSNGDGLFRLLCLLADSEAAWSERNFIKEALKSLPSDEAKVVLGCFVKSCLSQASQEQSQFYLGLLSHYGSCLLQPILDLLCNDSLSHSDEEFIECTKSVIQFQNDLTPIDRQKISDAFLHQIYQRKLWDSLECMYFAESPILVDWSAYTLSIFIQSYPHIDCRKELLLKKIPLDLALSLNVKKDLIALLQKSQDTSLKQRDFVDTLRWAEKLRSIEEKDVFLEKWREAIPELLNLCKEEEVFELTHQVFCWVNPHPGLWQRYIEIALKNAKITAVEKILDVLVDSQPLHLAKFLIPTLEKLHELGSMKFLRPLSFWPAIWNEINSEVMKRDLVYRLIQEASLVLDLTREVSVSEVLGILESEEVASFISSQDSLFRCDLRVDLAKIFWFSEVAEQRLNALTILYEAFVVMGDEPSTEKMAVDLFNKFLQTMPKMKSLREVQATLLLIQCVQMSDSSEYVDNAAILQFIRGQLKANHDKECEIFLDEAMGFIFHTINLNVKTILSRPALGSENESEEISSVKWGINRLYDSELLLGYDLAVWCLQRPNISRYLSKNEINKLKEYKELLKGDVVSRVIRVWEWLTECKNAVVSPIMRLQLVHAHGLQEDFRFKVEKSKKCGEL